MKKYLNILTVAILLSGFTGQAQGYVLQVYGNVYIENINNLVPVTGQPVTININDSVNGNYFNYQNTVYTNENGYFEDLVTLPPSITYGFVQATTYDSCQGQYLYSGQYFAYGTVLPGIDFILCSNPVPIGCENYFMYYYYIDPTTITFEGYMLNGQQALSYEWDFGDGSYASGQVVNHTFQLNPGGPGFYLVSLTTTAIDSIGDICTYTSWQEVWLPSPPECYAYYIYFPDSADIRTIHFQDMSVVFNGGMPSDWSWEFGDGNTSGLQNPVHTYADTGYYFVCLTITDSAGNCINTYCDNVYTGFPPPPSECESFIMPLNMYGLTVEFQGWTISQHPTEFAWEFGDGNLATGQFVTHTYANPGIFTVSLQTVDSTGCTFNTWMEIWVDSLWQGCSNYFYYEQLDSTTFTFTGEAFLNNGTVTDATLYLWDFGDGTTAAGQTVTHYFQPNPAGGIYTVCLETHTPLPDGDTCIAYSCQDIWLTQPTFSIFGHIYLGNNMTADQGLVRLMTMDTLWQNVMEVETVLIDSGGFYIFPDVAMYNSSLYFVQAELSEGSAYFGDYLPTYHLSSLSWENALPILPLMSWPVDVNMIPATTLNPGTGAITGTVTNLGTRGYVNDVLVVLLDSEMSPYYYTRSAEDGTFGFLDLPIGTYIVHAEIMGIHTNPATVVLGEGQAEVSIEIQVSGTEANVVFGIGDQNLTLGKVSEIYPNPVNSTSKIDISLKQAEIVNFDIINYAGNTISTFAKSLSAGTQGIRVESNSLPTGIYMIRITSAEGNPVIRRFIKIL